MKILSIALWLVILWAALVAIFFAFSSTINATHTKQGRELTGKMACLWALALTAIFVVVRWLL